MSMVNGPSAPPQPAPIPWQETPEGQAWLAEWSRTSPHQLDAATRALPLTVDEIRWLAHLGYEPDFEWGEDGRTRPRKRGTPHCVERDAPDLRSLERKGLVEFTAPDLAWLTPLGIDVHFKLWFPFNRGSTITANYRQGAYTASLKRTGARA